MLLAFRTVVISLTFVALSCAGEEEEPITIISIPDATNPNNASAGDAGTDASRNNASIPDLGAGDARTEPDASEPGRDTGGVGRDMGGIDPDMGPVDLTNAFEEPGEICTSDGWCWMNQLPMGAYVEDAWSPSADEHWLATRGGTVIRLSGGQMSRASFEVTDEMTAIWGSSLRNVWATWRGDSAFQWDGGQWRERPLPADFQAPSDVWGSGDDVFMVGGFGKVARWNGSSFSMLPSPTQELLYGVWASSPTDVWVGARGGNVYQWNGSSWRLHNLSDSGDINYIWGTSPDDVWVKNVGVVHHWDGSVWTSTTLGSSSYIQGMHGCGPDDIRALVGQTLHEFDGTEWTATSPGISTIMSGVRCLEGGSSLVYGRRPYIFDGADSTSQVQGWQQDVESIFVAPNGDAAVARLGTISHFDGANWVDFTAPTTYRGMHGLSATDIWGAGGGGRIGRFDGTSWSAVSTSIPSSISFRAIWALAQDNVVAFAQLGNVAIYDGQDWTAQASGSLYDFVDADGDGAGNVWAVGEFGASRYDGQDWQHWRSISSEELRGVFALSPTNVWAVGDNTTILNFDGTDWNVVSPPSDVFPTIDFLAISGSGPADLWIAGDQGRMLHWDGQGWQKRPSGTDSTLEVLVGGPSGDLWAGGRYGTLVRKQ